MIFDVSLSHNLCFKLQVLDRPPGIMFNVVFIVAVAVVFVLVIVDLKMFEKFVLNHWLPTTLCQTHINTHTHTTV